jgi:hypothetical protein
MGALVFRQQVLEALHNLSASLTNVTNDTLRRRKS